MFDIQEVNRVDIAFGGNMAKLLPKYEDIPKEYKNMNDTTKWNKLVLDWFYCGLKSLKLKPKVGVDTNKAMAHIKAIMASWEPKHEHKIAGCAYLLSQWFDDVQYEKGN
jgi:hypothetical protein